MKKIIALLCLICWVEAVLAQENPMGGLEYGEYKVGFELIELKDFSRTYIIAETESLHPRPMTIGVWFPAKNAFENDKEQRSELYSIAQRSVEGVSERNKLRLEELGTLWERESGSFPLVIYAAAQNSNGYGNIALCEMLASHGYIVATVASKGYSSRQMPFNELGSIAQTRDLEYLYGVMNSYPSLDIDKVATIGFSFGGLNMLALAENIRTIDVLVALDGSIGVGMSMLENQSTFRTDLLEVSLLAFLGDKAGLNDFPLFERAPFSELFIVKTNGLDHLDFGSANIEFRNRSAAIRTAYTEMANRSRFFIDTYLKGKKWSDEIVSLDSDSFTKAEIQTVENKPEVQKEDFINFVTSNGIDEGIRVYYETKANFPNYQLFDYGSFRDVGFLKLQQEQVEEAIKIYRVLLDAYPENDDSYRRLGEALMLNGDYEESKEHLTKGLEINPSSPALKDIMRRLLELKKEK